MENNVYSEAMVNADMAFTNANYALALEWFRKALEENPDDLLALAKAGTACVPLEKYEESVEFFKKAYELDPANGENAFNLGNAYFFSGNYGKALEAYADAERKGCSDETKPKLYYQMAMLCSVKQDVKNALVNFKKYEESDKTGLASLDTGIISEKIKLYMMTEDYENAAKCAVQWITIAPTEINGYMVYFNILMAMNEFLKAEEAIEEAEKYAEMDDNMRFSLNIERVALMAAIAETDPENAMDHYQIAYDMLTDLRNHADASKVDELWLTSAEICMKMERYDEAIAFGEALLPSDGVQQYDIPHYDTDVVSDLSEADIEAMAEEDMTALDEKISAGEISDDAGEYAEVYYDAEGNPVRDYPEGTFSDLETSNTGYAAVEEAVYNANGTPERTVAFYDRLYFILLSCYAAVENYECAYKLGGQLKHSENEYYSYFARYTEAFSMKKLSETDAAITKEAVEDIYAETIAFYRSKMLKDHSNFAVVFRARMYAEIGKFVKAEEMANLLVLDEKVSVMEYIEQCRKEYQV